MDLHIKEFVRDYRKTQPLYEDVAGLTEKICERLLRAVDVQGKVTSRAKDPESLEGKLHDRAAKWGSITGRKDFYDKLHDLAGVRILLYFPNDIPTVTRQIMRLFKNVQNPEVRVSRREANVPNQAGDYTQGLWRSVSADNVNQNWKHAGYRAVHLVVDVNQLLAEMLSTQEKVEETGEEEDEIILKVKKKVRDNFSEKLSKDSRARIERSVRHDKVVKVEVQITTVVMHAWSEVEHDIIYKNKHNFPDNGTLNRMLDGINGLSITSEILLDEMHRTMQDLRHKSRFAMVDGTTFCSWLQVAYPPESGINYSYEYVDFVIRVFRDMKIWNTQQVQELIARQEKFVRKSTDFSSQILQMLSLEDTAKQHLLRCGLLCLSGSNLTVLNRLYKLLEAVNTFGIMVAMSGFWILSDLGPDCRALLKVLNRATKFLINFEATYLGSVTSNTSQAELKAISKKANDRQSVGNNMVISLRELVELERSIVRIISSKSSERYDACAALARLSWYISTSPESARNTSNAIHSATLEPGGLYPVLRADKTSNIEKAFGLAPTDHLPLIDFRFLCKGDSPSVSWETPTDFIDSFTRYTTVSPSSGQLENHDYRFISMPEWPMTSLPLHTCHVSAESIYYFLKYAERRVVSTG